MQKQPSAAKASGGQMHTARLKPRPSEILRDYCDGKMPSRESARRRRYGHTVYNSALYNRSN